MREIVFFTKMESYFSNNLYSEMIKNDSVTPVVINKNSNLSRFIMNSKEDKISLIYIVNDQSDLSILFDLKQYLEKIVFIFLEKNKELLKEALSLNPSLIIMSSNNIKNNFPIMEKVLEM